MENLNDRGFSLVELIIVITIMSVLVGVLAPNYMKFVERSRESVDISTMASVYNYALAEYNSEKLEDETVYYYDIKSEFLYEDKPERAYGRGSEAVGRASNTYYSYDPSQNVRNCVIALKIKGGSVIEMWWEEL